MPGRRHRAAAILAVVALLLAAPYERGRRCDVCPIDCPMHGARQAAGHLGCHQGTATAKPPQADAGACAMRATCGHHGHGTVAFFHGELVPVLAVEPVVIARCLAAPPSPALASEGAAPLAPPPEHSVG